jgi:transketolase C-terminal domain/subunit
MDLFVVISRNLFVVIIIFLRYGFESQNTPKQFIECYIAEQNLVGVATGVACRDRAIAFVSTFAAFYTRAFDQVQHTA